MFVPFFGHRYRQHADWLTTTRVFLRDKHVDRIDSWLVQGAANQFIFCSPNNSRHLSHFKFQSGVPVLQESLECPFKNLVQLYCLVPPFLLGFQYGILFTLGNTASAKMDVLVGISCQHGFFVARQLFQRILLPLSIIAIITIVTQPIHTPCETLRQCGGEGL